MSKRICAGSSRDVSNPTGAASTARAVDEAGAGASRALWSAGSMPGEADTGVCCLCNEWASTGNERTTGCSGRAASRAGLEVVVKYGMFNQGTVLDIVVAPAATGVPSAAGNVRRHCRRFDHVKDFKKYSAYYTTYTLRNTTVHT